MPANLIVLGASARALAFSALRAGFAPVCGDLFADKDLRHTCRVTRVAAYPAELEMVSRQSPDGPWMYSGALENYPELIERISASRPLLGNPADVVRQVRDPLRVAAALAAAGLPHPDVADSAAELPRDGTWLVKRRHSSGGSHVRPWDAHANISTSSLADWYFQQRIDGMPCAGIFLARGGRCRLLGVTRQLIGPTWAHCGAWQYAGSIGPLTLSNRRSEQWLRIGQCLSQEFGLAGLFGVDAVVDEGHVWPVEINPRYTASVEILERGLSIPAVAWHVRACRECELPGEVPATSNCMYGKAILFSGVNTIASAETIDGLMRENDHKPWPAAADIPPVATSIRTGRPVATVFANGENVNVVYNKLRREVARLETWFE